MTIKIVAGEHPQAEIEQRIAQFVEHRERMADEHDLLSPEAEEDMRMAYFHRVADVAPDPKWEAARAEERPRFVNRQRTTKPIERKTWHVVVKGGGSDKSLHWIWSKYGDHDQRTAGQDRSHVVTAMDTLGGDLRLVLVYTVRGGFPSDIRRWLGNELYARPLDEDEVTINRAHKEVVPDPRRI